MSQGIPSGLEGQIDSPNSLELWWEKNKRILIGIGIALIAAVALNYGLKYMDQRATDARWSGLAAAANLDAKYSDVDAGGDAQTVFRKLFERQTGLVDGLYEDLKAADGTELDKKLAEAKGDKVMEPIVLWLVASRAIANEDFAAAREHLGTLKSSYPDHFLVASSDYPPQWRARVDPKAEVKPNRAPELVDAEIGSLVDRMLARIDAEEKFRAAHPEFYVGPQPDSDKVAILELESEDGSGFDGEIKIRFYATAAPKHYEAFLRLVQDGTGFFDGIRIHFVERPGETPSVAGAAHEFKFGMKFTKTEADVSKWTAANWGEVDEANQVEWEENDISHFPGALAAEPYKGGSQVERLAINGDDVARGKDGSRVVFGRVIEGLDFVKRLIDDVEFANEQANRFGRGAPSDRVRIRKIRIEDA